MLPKLFASYLQHGRYLRGWSPKTEVVYQRAFTSFQAGSTDSNLSKASLEAWLIWMRKRELAPACINIYIRAMNAFCGWLKEEGHLTETLKLKQVPDPKKPITVFSPDDIRRITSYKPYGFTELRTWVLLQTLLDTGCRINELLTLSSTNIDFDNLLLTVLGKGNKTRKAPFSPELRKVLFRFKVLADKKLIQRQLFFCVRNGKAIRYRNIYRDILKLCAKVGITKRIHIHLTRHTFACHFMKQGGSIYSLSRILGHSSVSTTQIYIRGLGVEDFQAEQARLSPLAAR